MSALSEIERIAASTKFHRRSKELDRTDTFFQDIVTYLTKKAKQILNAMQFPPNLSVLLTFTLWQFRTIASLLLKP